MLKGFARSVTLIAALLCLSPPPARAAAGMDRAAIVRMFCVPFGHQVPQAAARVVAALPDANEEDLAWANIVGQAFYGRALLCGADGHAYIGSRDAVTLAKVSPIPVDVEAPFLNLRTRAILDRTMAEVSLFAAPRAESRLAAVETLEQHSEDVPPAVPRAALQREHDVRVLAALRDLAVLQALHAPDSGPRIDAIKALALNSTSRTLVQLQGLRADQAYSADPAVASALDVALAHVRFWVEVGNILSLLYNGISAGSVLFMSSVGLAIIFGLMGVINLAQGELIMVGAYMTYSVQQVMRAVAPDYVALYPIVSIPVVFIVSALIGIVIEVTVIRHLYRRPLMTLLATWGISLLLVNLVRVTFGTENLEFITPSYLTGGVALVGDFFVTWNHLAAILFAIAAFIAVQALLRLTSLGLFIRGVTQNRDMAGCVGVSQRRIDMLAFGFGAGFAGLGGLALSPIYNVNPSMGSGFIIDSFMVVVLGGVGSLAGTAAAALGIGLVNVGIEPFYGAVAAKVIALLLIILLIQWRPEGLIAIRGRR